MTVLLTRHSWMIFLTDIINNMGATKDLFIKIRESEMEDIPEGACTGNCLECIYQCGTTQTDLIEYIKLNEED